MCMLEGRAIVLLSKLTLTKCHPERRIQCNVTMNVVIFSIPHILAHLDWRPIVSSKISIKPHSNLLEKVSAFLSDLRLFTHVSTKPKQIRPAVMTMDVKHSLGLTISSMSRSAITTLSSAPPRSSVSWRPSGPIIQAQPPLLR